MTAPVRILLSRKRGFNLQDSSLAKNGLPAVSVSRPGPFGNPFRVWRDDVAKWTVSCGGCHWTPDTNTRAAALALAVKLYREWLAGGNMKSPQPPSRSQIIKALRGRNLACWCPYRQGCCHGDVLLEIANGPLCEAVELTTQREHETA